MTFDGVHLLIGVILLFGLEEMFSSFKKVALSDEELMYKYVTVLLNRRYKKGGRK